LRFYNRNPRLVVRGIFEMSNDKKTTGAITKRKKKRRISPYQFRCATLIFDGLLVFVGAVYSFFAYQQWRSMDKQIKEAQRASRVAERSIEQAERNARLDQRAWVSVEGINGFPEPRKPFLITVTLINTGKTFAKDIETVNASVIAQGGDVLDYSGEIRKNARDPNFAKYHFPLAPNHPIDRILTTGAALSDTQIQDLKSGNTYFLLWGQITYDDVFRYNRWLTFCGVLRYYLDRQPQWRWEYCKDKNDTGDGEPPWK
jgi:hypothetical protein